MATIKFYTRSKVGDRLAPLYLKFIDGRDLNIRFSTDLKMIPDYWNESKQAIKQRVIFTEQFTADNAQEVLNQLELIRQAIFREINKPETIVNKDTLNKIVESVLNKQVSVNEGLNDYIYRFICEAHSGQRLCYSGKTKKAYSDGTLRSLRDFQRSFDIFQGIYSDRVYGSVKARKTDIKNKRDFKPLNWPDITIDWYNDFIQFSYKRNNSANYIGKHIKTFKAILRQAREEGYPVNNELDRKAFKAISEESDSIYLTSDEVTALYKLNLSDHLEVARDVFLCGVYTAQRYSDYSRINKEMIRTVSGTKVVEFRQQKTNEKVTIPMRPELLAILKKYEYTLPRTHEQKVNEYMKVIGEKAGITELIHIEKSKGGMRVKSSLPKCKLIKTHTARRTGCTLMYLAGIPTLEIMRISGHKTEREFLKYVKVTKQETAIKLSKHPYFTLKAV